MIVTIAVPEVIYHQAIPPKEKPITKDLRSQYDLIIDVHATCETNNLSFPEASSWHIKRLKEHEEHEKEKWDDFVNIVEECKDNRHRHIEKLSKFRDMWDGHLRSIK